MEGSETDISTDKLSSCVLFCLFATEESLLQDADSESLLYSALLPRA